MPEKLTFWRLHLECYTYSYTQIIMNVTTACIMNNHTELTVINNKSQITYLVSFLSIHRQNQREVLHYKFCCRQ